MVKIIATALCIAICALVMWLALTGVVGIVIAIALSIIGLFEKSNESRRLD